MQLGDIFMDTISKRELTIISIFKRRVLLEDRNTGDYQETTITYLEYLLDEGIFKRGQ